MAASATPKPKTTPIPGGTIAFNTTGYPSPTPPPGNTTGYPDPPPPPGTSTVRVLEKATGTLSSVAGPETMEEKSSRTPVPYSYEVQPSYSVLEFSVADLSLLGKVTDVRELVFEMIFLEPRTAKVERFKLEIVSPERKLLFSAELVSENCIEHRDHSVHTFSLNPKDAQLAEHQFVPGNKVVIDTRTSEKVVFGRLQAAVRKY